MDKLFEELQVRTDEGKRFYEDIFEKEEYKAVLDRKADVVIDLGANIGNFSYYIYDKAQVIYAIEANTDNYLTLCNYIKRYNLTKIKAYNLAIGKSNDTRPLYLAGGCGSFTLYPNGTTPVQEVEANTLTRFMEKVGITHVDILKIDVEGAEMEIFSTWENPDIDFIIGENHGHNLKPLLVDYGYDYKEIERNFIAEKL